MAPPQAPKRARDDKSPESGSEHPRGHQKRRPSRTTGKNTYPYLSIQIYILYLITDLTPSPGTTSRSPEKSRSRSPEKPPSPSPEKSRSRSRDGSRSPSSPAKDSEAVEIIQDDRDSEIVSDIMPPPTVRRRGGQRVLSSYSSSANATPSPTPGPSGTQQPTQPSTPGPSGTQQPTQPSEECSGKFNLVTSLVTYVSRTDLVTLLVSIS